MNRRELIQYTALASGAAVCSPLLSLLLSGCSTDPSKLEANVGLSYFKAKDFELIKAVVDAILPKTDSPAGTEVGVPKMIDWMVGQGYRPNEKEGFESRFGALKNFLNEKGFMNLSNSEKEDLLKGLPGEKEGINEGYIELKQMAIAFYLSSETVTMNFLNYLPVPGGYDPCISVDEVGNKAWYYEV